MSLIINFYFIFLNLVFYLLMSEDIKSVEYYSLVSLTFLNLKVCKITNTSQWQEHIFRYATFFKQCTNAHTRCCNKYLISISFKKGIWKKIWQNLWIMKKNYILIFEELSNMHPTWTLFLIKKTKMVIWLLAKLSGY